MSLARSIPSSFTFWPLLVISDVLSWMRLEIKSVCIVSCLPSVLKLVYIPPIATSLKRVSATWLFVRKLTHLG